MGEVQSEAGDGAKQLVSARAAYAKNLLVLLQEVAPVFWTAGKFFKYVFVFVSYVLI